MSLVECFFQVHGRVSRSQPRSCTVIRASAACLLERSHSSNAARTFCRRIRMAKPSLTFSNCASSTPERARTYTSAPPSAEGRNLLISPTGNSAAAVASSAKSGAAFIGGGVLSAKPGRLSTV